VRAATIVWPVPQANILTVSRLDRELVVAIRDKAPYSLATGVDKVIVTQGEKINIPLKMTVHWPDFKSNVQLSAAALPPGLNLAPMTLNPAKDSATAVLDSKGGAALPPGQYTIVLRGQTQPINPKVPVQPPKGGPPNHVQVTPPIPLVVIPKQLGKLTVTPASAKVQPGKEVELTVKLARQSALPLPLKVELILPESVKGLSAGTATIAADQEEAKLVIAAAPDASLDAAVPVTIRATAMFDDKVPIVHEAKVNVAVVK